MVGIVAIPAALKYALQTTDCPEPWSISSHRSIRGGNDFKGSLSIYVFRHEVVSRAFIDESQFEVEDTLWHFTPGCILMASCAIVGWFAGRVLHYRLIRRRE